MESLTVGTEPAPPACYTELDHRVKVRIDGERAKPRGRDREFGVPPPFEMTREDTPRHGTRALKPEHDFSLEAPSMMPSMKRQS